MTLQEYRVQEGARVDTQAVDYRDHDQIEQLISRGWTHIGAQRWAASPLPGTEADMSSPKVFLPRLADDCIRGNGLILTHPVLDDAADLCANELDDEVRRHAIFPPTSPAAMESQIVGAYAGWRLGDSTFLVARQDVDGPPLAKISIRRLVPPGVLDVGYATLRSHRGRGYAATALRMFTEWVFEAAGIQRIELGIKPGNRASVATALKAGYRLESVRQSRLRNVDGSFDDEHSYVAIHSDCDRVWRYTA